MSKHLLELVSSFLTIGVKATCSCGWEGPRREDTADAHDDFATHLSEQPDSEEGR